MRIAVGLAVLVAGCFTPTDLAKGPLHAKLGGDCAPEGATIEVTEVDDVLTAKVPAGSELPSAGGPRLPGPVREGGWYLYGYHCPPGGPDCRAPEQFRFCSTRRDGWQLELVCVDGLAQPVCRGTISE